MLGNWFKTGEVKAKVAKFYVPGHGNFDVWDVNREWEEDIASSLLLLTEEESQNYIGGELSLEGIHNHDRAVGTPIMLSGNSGYYYIDIKGTGGWFDNEEFEETLPTGEKIKVLRKSVKEIDLDNTTMYAEKVVGSQDLKWAKRDHFTQKLIKKTGVRTHESVGVLVLDEIFYNGKKRKIEYEKKTKRRYVYNDDNQRIYFPVGFVPAQQVRLWATPYRVEDTKSDKIIDGKKQSNEIPEGELSPKEKFENVLWLLRKELKVGEEFGIEEYLRWFAETLGKNLGLLHINGFAHNFLHGGNITLDCRLTDFDSVVTFHSIEKSARRKDHTLDEETIYKGFEDLVREDLGLVEYGGDRNSSNLMGAYDVLMLLLDNVLEAYFGGNENLKKKWELDLQKRFLEKYQEYGKMLKGFSLGLLGEKPGIDISRKSLVEANDNSIEHEQNLSKVLQ